ncbi:MAG TPA: DEAD/DEAH box helicase, partial [Candidatus Limnocylindrales bacterium]
MADATAAPLELGLGGVATVDAGDALVEVAVDAPGAAGAVPYTYRLGQRSHDVGPGEAVIVPYGRRQALGIVLGPAAAAPDGRDVRDVVDRVRADGPLLPPLGLALARWVGEHYLAPPVATIRSFLPPGLLERLELVAERRPVEIGAERLDAVDADIVDQLERGPRRVRDVESAEGRAAVLRRLRALAASGFVDLDWTLVGASAGPRYERWVEAVQGAPEVAPVGRLGPRQRAALDELAAFGGPVRSADLAGRHGQATVASLVRRGLIRADVRERPRRPLGSRPPASRGARPVGAGLTPEQAEAVDRVVEAIVRRDPTPLLLDGITGAGKTAVYVEAIAASLAAGRPALVLVPEIALATPLVDRLRADLAVELAVVHSGLGAGERADEWRRIRAGGVDVVVGTRAAVGAPLADVGLVVVDEEHEAAYKSDRTPRLQARDTAIRLAELAGAAVVLGSATPAVDSVGHVREGR